MITNNMRILFGAAIALAVVAGGAYAMGRRDGADVVRSGERAAQLRANAAAIAGLAPKIERATAVKETRQASSAAARAEYSSARSRITIRDTTAIQIDGGPVLTLPAPVITTIARGTELARTDSLTQISQEAWGALWKAKAELLEVRVGLLEDQLVDERRANRRAQIKAVAIGAGLGVVGGALLGH